MLVNPILQDSLLVFRCYPVIVQLSLDYSKTMHKMQVGKSITPVTLFPKY